MRCPEEGRGERERKGRAPYRPFRREAFDGPPDERERNERAQHVNGDVDDTVAGRIEAVNRVIERERQVDDRPARDGQLAIGKKDRWIP